MLGATPVRCAGVERWLEPGEGETLVGLALGFARRSELRPGEKGPVSGFDIHHGFCTMLTHGVARKPCRLDFGALHGYVRAGAYRVCGKQVGTDGGGSASCWVYISGATSHKTLIFRCLHRYDIN